MLEMTPAQTAPLWGTFGSLRDLLFNQFEAPPFDPATGVTPDELATEIRAHLTAHPDQPRILQRAHSFRIAVTRAQIAIDPRDWFVDKLNHGGIVRRVRDEWVAAAKAAADVEEDAWSDRMEELGALRLYFLDLGHISPGWERMLSGGLTGLIEEARARRKAMGDAATADQRAFYEAVEIVYTAIIELAARFARHARDLIPAHPDAARRLEAIACTCDRVPAHAPETFHEALQFAWLMHELIEMEGEWVRSMGHFDRTFYPYYKADLDAGRLTEAQARELTQFLWYKYYARTRGKHNGKNFVFAGQYPDGSEVVNDLTYLALDAYEELNTPDPKLSVRFTSRTPDKLYRRVADLIRSGHNAFVLLNDDVAVDALVKRGKTLEDARLYLPIGCYEPAVEGKEVGCTMNLVVNLAKSVELALHNGRDPLSGQQAGPHTGDPREFATFEDLFEAYRCQMQAMLARSAAYMAKHERVWPEVSPSPVIAATIDDCLALGKDISEGGAHYNSVGCTGAGLANAADALLAVKRAVFDEGRLTMEELVEALDHNFAGREPLRQYLLNRVPKWGTDNPDSNDLTTRIVNTFCDTVHTFENGRGGGAQASLFTLDYQWSMGLATGALPDGRRAGEGLAPGCGATAGQDREGVTALIHSVSALDFKKTPNGAVLDITLHPSAVAGDEGLDAFVTLIKTFFAQGGYALQFNVFDIETLREAQLHPERFATLQIRVTGWSVYFTTLSREIQDQFIARNAHRAL
jgi:pyruvate formate-lyase/glycerol dehydratase family glycyl radical enzyme